MVVVWCDDLDSFGEEMDHEWLSLWRSGRISEREETPRSWWEVAEVWDKPRLFAEPLVDLNIDCLPGTRVWDLVIREMDDKPRQWLKHWRCQGIRVREGVGLVQRGCS